MSEKRMVYAEDVIQRIRDLAHGKPYGCATPWFVAWLGSLHGVVCTACGHYKPTVIAWNREWRKKNAQ